MPESQVRVTRSWSWSFTVTPQEGEEWPDTKASHHLTYMRPDSLHIKLYPNFDGKVGMNSPELRGPNVKKDGTTGTQRREVHFYSGDVWPDYVTRYVEIARAQVEAELATMKAALGV